jgi:membrane-associated protease RseP (regulator of RpoE activity)
LTASPPLLPADLSADPAGQVWRVPEPPRRFQDVVWKHGLLFLLTDATTTYAGGGHYLAFVSEFGRVPLPPFEWGLILQGFWYSGSILAILGAHEMGHYLACRYYKVDATLPYFLPLFLPGAPALTGTLGAVIKIREAFPTRTILFDIGVAGPIAGFVVLLGVLFAGLTQSNVIAAPTETGNLIYFGEPLLFKWAAWLMFGSIPEGRAFNMHPMVFAAWFGMLATALNLLPFGQLDGGHLTYATLGRWSTPISIATVGTALVMTFISTSWIIMTVMMLVMLFFLGPRHPRVIYEHEPLGRGRQSIAILALVILALCFTPVPIAFAE